MDSILKFALGFIAIIFIGSCITIGIPRQEEVQRANGYKLDNCIKLANAIGLDPNDDARATTIQNCYEGN